MDRGAWRATIHGAMKSHKESDTTEQLTLTSLFLKHSDDSYQPPRARMRTQWAGGWESSE